jgi:hypothetical protein
MSRYYLAGPMSGYPQFNFPLFHEVASKLRMQGYTIVSPAELDSPAVQAAAGKSADGALDKDGKIAGETWGDILAKDVKLVADGIDGIIFLPNWEASRGANLEATVGLLVNKRPFEFLQWDGNSAVPVSKTSVACSLHRAMYERTKQ